MAAPEISVVIPMYNAEKYIAECLESLLAQTFKNFEVIIVDDLSTDSSPAIVESYRDKFGGRLTFSHMETNTGSGAIPRNKGLMLSRGEYVFFMDSDDMLTQTALEGDYNFAREYGADVVHHVRYLVSDNKSNVMQIREFRHEDITDNPVFETDDLVERTRMRILSDTLGIEPWTNLVRRNLLMENKIFFYRVRYAEDYFWSYLLLLHAKRWLRVPNPICIHREHELSMTRKDRTVQNKIEFWLNPLVFGLKNLESDLQRIELFRQNPDLLYDVLQRFVMGHFNVIFSETQQTSLSLSDFYETVKKDLGNALGEQKILVAALCTYINFNQRAFSTRQNKFKQFVAQTQEQVNKFNQFAAAATQRIAQLETEVKRLKS